jgi:predicted PurR-regulated permease PerM
MRPPLRENQHTVNFSEEKWAFLLLLLTTTIAFGWIMVPFFSPILWGAIIALLFTPVNRWLLPRLKNRRTATALLTLLIVLVMVILPFALITASLAQEAAHLYKRIGSGELNPAGYVEQVFAALPVWVTTALDRVGVTDVDALQQRLIAAVSAGSRFIASQALNIGLNTFDFVARLFITLYLAFFLIRDGSALSHRINMAMPLAPEHKRELGEKFSAVIRATVKGNLLVAAIQGMLGGLAFWFLGVNAPLLWTILMAFLSLIPAVGAGLVWAPVAIYFLVTGAVWQGIALAAYGVLIIGLVDNLLRPILVGKDTKMPDYLIMIATLGGMAVFGINGFVLGPAVAAMFIALWHIYASSQHRIF